MKFQVFLLIFLILYSIIKPNFSGSENMSKKEEYKELSAFKMYMKEIKEIPILTPDEEYNLALKIKDGDKEAKKRLVEANLRLVVPIAYKYINRGMDILDLIGCGNEGLMIAADKFNPEKNCKFRTYAYCWIRVSIFRAIATQVSMIHIPVFIAEKVPLILTAQQKLTSLLQREPTIEEIANETNLKKQVVQTIFNKYISLNQYVDDEEKNELMDLIYDSKDNTEEIAVQKVASEELIKKLKSIKGIRERDLRIFLLRKGYVDDKIWRCEEIGKLYNITKQRVQKIEARVLRKIQLSPNLFKFYIGG